MVYRDLVILRNPHAVCFFSILLARVREELVSPLTADFRGPMTRTQPELAPKASDLLSVSLPSQESFEKNSKFELDLKSVLCLDL